MSRQPSHARLQLACDTQNAALRQSLTEDRKNTVSMGPIHKDIIAREDYVQKLEDGTTKSISVIIGTPYQIRNRWKCPAKLHGLPFHDLDMDSESSMQSLSMAISRVLAALAYEVRAGMALFRYGDCFGPPLREAEIFEDFNDFFEFRDSAPFEFEDDSFSDLSSAKAKVLQLRRALTEMEISRDFYAGQVVAAPLDDLISGDH